MLFLLGALGSILLLQGAATARYGFEPAYVHIANMLDHNDPLQISSRRAGLALALSFDGRRLETVRDENGDIVRDASGAPDTEDPYRAPQTAMADQALRYGLGALFLLVMGWAMRDKRTTRCWIRLPALLPSHDCVLLLLHCSGHDGRGSWRAPEHTSPPSGAYAAVRDGLFCNLARPVASIVVPHRLVVGDARRVCHRPVRLASLPRQPPESALTPSDASAR